MHFLIDSVISTTLSISVIDSVLLGIVAFLLVLPFIHKKRVKTKLWLLGAIVYGFLLLFLTIPIVLEPYPDSFTNKIAFVFSDIIWDPLDSVVGLSSFSDFITLIVGNFCLLMPVAVLTVARNPNSSLKNFFALPLLTSLAIEGMQFVGNVLIGYSNRTVETLDVILNVLGSLVCFLITKAVIKAYSTRKKCLL